MTALRPLSSASEPSLFRAAAIVGQHILTRLAESARAAADRGRFAALPRRYLDDAGMTPGDFGSALTGFDAMDAREATVALAHSV